MAAQTGFEIDRNTASSSDGTGGFAVPRLASIFFNTSAAYLVAAVFSPAWRQYRA
jgi:hypothetical protein